MKSSSSHAGSFFFIAIIDNHIDDTAPVAIISAHQPSVDMFVTATRMSIRLMNITTEAIVISGQFRFLCFLFCVFFIAFSCLTS